MSDEVWRLELEQLFSQWNIGSRLHRITPMEPYTKISSAIIGGNMAELNEILNTGYIPTSRDLAKAVSHDRLEMIEIFVERYRVWDSELIRPLIEKQHTKQLLMMLDISADYAIDYALRLAESYTKTLEAILDAYMSRLDGDVMSYCVIVGRKDLVIKARALGDKIYMDHLVAAHTRGYHGLVVYMMETGVNDLYSFILDLQMPRYDIHSLRLIAVLVSLPRNYKVIRTMRVFTRCVSHVDRYKIWLMLKRPEYLDEYVPRPLRRLEKSSRFSSYLLEKIFKL